MASAKDLTGQRFGRLTALELDPEPYISPAGKPARRWRCRCDCGAELTVLQNALTGKNGTRSCGCARRDSMRALGVDMTGQRFGRLLVVDEVELDKPEPNGNRRGWRCVCDCGKETVVTRKDILGGLQSCGCLLSETAAKKITEDNVVGHFEGTTVTAIGPARRLNSNNTSGVRGVHWSTSGQCWIARIGFRGRDIYLGRFKRLEDAEKARKDAESEYYAPVIEAYESQNQQAEEPPE